MNKVLVMGSIAYDYIMRFNDIFANHILPERLQILNVCFTAQSLSKNFGGTAGNIAYSLKLLQEEPLVCASVGKDFADYKAWMAELGICSSEVQVHQDEWTASAHIVTDKNENQITAFHGGAMFRNDIPLAQVMDRHPEITYAIIAPDGRERMLSNARELQQRKLRYIYDPGHSLPSFNKDELLFLTKGCFLLVLNDYEIHLFLEKTQLTQDALLEQIDYLIVTHGGKGSTIYHRGKSMSIPAVKPRKVVDPTGAGDAYRGGLLKALLHNLPIEVGAQLGSVVACYTVEAIGTQGYRFSVADFKARFVETYGKHACLDQIFKEA